MRRAPIMLAVCYAIPALATYGIAAETHRRDAWAEYSVCRSVALNNPNQIADCRSPGGLEAPITGLVSAALWPLWWSWTAAERMPR